METLDGDVLAWLYVLNFYEGGLPSARNIGILADAAEKAGRTGGLRGHAARAALRQAGRLEQWDVAGVRAALDLDQGHDEQDQRRDDQGGDAPGGSRYWPAARASPPGGRASSAGDRRLGSGRRALVRGPGRRRRSRPGARAQTVSAWAAVAYSLSCGQPTGLRPRRARAPAPRGSLRPGTAAAAAGTAHRPTGAQATGGRARGVPARPRSPRRACGAGSSARPRR